MSKHHITLSTLVFASLAACGGSSSPEVAELGDSGAASGEALCRRVTSKSETFLAEHAEGYCKLTGAFVGAFSLEGADPAATCEEAYASCLAEPPPTESSCDDLPPIDCDAPAEIESCVDDTLAQVGRAFDEIAAQSCADLVSQGAVSSGPEPVEPESCVQLRQKCPALFTEGSVLTAFGL